MGVCRFCNREISNYPSLKSHELCCKANPNRVARHRPPRAGKRAGSIAHNKGMTYPQQALARTVKLITTGEYRSLHECVIRKHIKRWLISVNGHHCEMCGNSVWNNRPIPLVCDHIDGDSTNNDLSNFRLICCNCDAQLPTYKSKNKGRGRRYDREYYRFKKEDSAMAAKRP